MKVIFPNIWTLILRIVLIALFLYMYQWPVEKIRTGEYLIHSSGLFLFGLFAYSLFPIYLIWTLLGVLFVKISIDGRFIKFYYLYKRIKVFENELDGYFKTTHETKVSSYKGFLIKLKSEKVIEVTTYNLKSVEFLQEFLNSFRIPLKGEKKSWFPYKRSI